MNSLNIMEKKFDDVIPNDFIERYCLSDEEITKRREYCTEKSDILIKNISPENLAETEILVISLKTISLWHDYPDRVFAYTMDKLGKLFYEPKDFDKRDFVVIYAKPEDKHGDINPQIIIKNQKYINYLKELEKENKKKK